MSAAGLAIAFTAPEHAPLELTAQEIVVPGAGGVFTVMPGHTALLSTLLPGVVEVTDEKGEQRHIAISGGFAEVRDDTVTILADAFEPGTEVDLKRAQAAHARAEERLAKPDESVDVIRAEAALARALARLQAHKKETGS